MKKENLTAEDVLAIRIGRLVKENAELEQRVQELVEKYNDVVQQFMDLKYRYDNELKTKIDEISGNEDLKHGKLDLKIEEILNQVKELSSKKGIQLLQSGETFEAMYTMTFK